MSNQIYFPEMHAAGHARRMLESLNNARPWDTTFLCREPGCMSVGQDTELATAIERAMEKRFVLWADSWIRPHLEDIIRQSEQSVQR